MRFWPTAAFSLALRGGRRRAGGGSADRAGRPRGAAAEPVGRAGREPDRRRGPTLRLPRRDQARERPRVAGHRRRRSRLPRRRRLDGRVHRLPPAARCGKGRRHRRGLRPAGRPPAAGSACARGRAPQRAGDGAGGPSLRARSGDGRRLLHLPGEGPAGDDSLPAAAGGGAGDGEAAVRARQRAGRARASSATAADRREAILGVAAVVRQLGLPVRGFASSGLPGPKGNRETFIWCGGTGPGLEDLVAAVLAVEGDE